MFPSRQYKRLRTLIQDPRHDCVLFSNEFQEYCYCPREKGESLEKWQSRWVRALRGGRSHSPLHRWG